LYHPDHLGTTNALTDVNAHRYQFFLNLPFGETMAEQTSVSYYQTEFKFNAKELDRETGMYYYGARYYDPSLSIWMSIDPMAEQMPSWSPYNYVFNNPINLIDPTGMAPEVLEWKPDKNGNLVSEAGDNKTTLAKHLNISESKASNMINKQNLTRDNYVESDPSVTKGQTLIVDNNMKRGTDSETDTSDKTSYQYNCHDCSKAVVKGEELSSSMTSRGAPSLADPIFTTRKDKNYKKYTTEVTANEAVFGKTVITIGTLHSVVYYGKSQDGTVYAFTKEGHSSLVKPRVEKFLDIYNRHNATTEGDEKIRYFNYNSN
jgi:RHS repeat-associated protein